jgi:endonuclease/exonuclease/phosphatase family metal-dependent hydrolase
MTGKYVADRLKDDFIGSHEAFKRASGLVDARSYAKLNLDNFEDRPTSTDTQITTYTSMFQLPVVIDYTFFSPEMNLMKYEVMTGDVYETISDHAPVVTTYQYDTTGGT